uniref:Uncharacterized protein n=1 Tax=Panagrolaimus sp. JU765 TaxID=591449 RepID=A0AC34R8H0_9BILA
MSEKNIVRIDGTWVRVLEDAKYDSFCSDMRDWEHEVEIEDDVECGDWTGSRISEKNVVRIDDTCVRVLKDAKYDSFCSQMWRWGHDVEIEDDVECGDWESLRNFHDIFYFIHEFTKTGNERKIKKVTYDPAEFKKAADKYYTAKPRDLVQTSEKLWLGAVYTVKEYFLKLRVLPKSHKSLSTLVDTAVSQCDGEKSNKLTNAWDYAEKFHQYAYGSINFPPNEFDSRKKAVEKFIDEFPKINDEAVKKLLKQNIEEGKIGECQFQAEEKNIKLGKRKYNYDYIVF